MNLLKCKISNSTTRCNDCIKKSTTCKHPQILIDPNVFIAKYLLEKDTYNLASKFIEKHRRKHRIVITHLGYGEILNRIFKNKDEFDTFYEVRSAILKDLYSFECIETPFGKPDFDCILDALLETQFRSIGNRDKVHIATAVYHKVTFCSFDEKIHDDIELINSTIDPITTNKTFKWHHIKK